MASHTNEVHALNALLVTLHISSARLLTVQHRHHEPYRGMPGFAGVLVGAGLCASASSPCEHDPPQCPSSVDEIDDRDEVSKNSPALDIDSTTLR